MQNVWKMVETYFLIPSGMIFNIADWCNGSMLGSEPKAGRSIRPSAPILFRKD